MLRNLQKNNEIKFLQKISLENAIGLLLALGMYVQVKLSLDSQIQPNVTGQASSLADGFAALMQQLLTPAQGKKDLQESFAGTSQLKSTLKDTNTISGQKPQAASKRKQLVVGAQQGEALISGLSLDSNAVATQVPFATLTIRMAAENKGPQTNIGFVRANAWQSPKYELNSASVVRSAFASNQIAAKMPTQKDGVEVTPSARTANFVGANHATSVENVDTLANVAVQNDGEKSAPLSNDAVSAEKATQTSFSEKSVKASLTEDVSKEVVLPETSSMNLTKTRDLTSAQSAAVNTERISDQHVNRPFIQASLVENVRSRGGQSESLRTKSSSVPSAGTVNLPSNNRSNSAHGRSGEASAAQEPTTSPAVNTSSAAMPRGKADAHPLASYEGKGVEIKEVVATTPSVTQSVPVTSPRTQDERIDVSATSNTAVTAVPTSAHLSHESLKAAVSAQLVGEISQSLPQTVKQTSAVRGVAPKSTIKPRVASVTATAPSRTAVKAKTDSVQPKTKMEAQSEQAETNSPAEQAPIVPAEKHESVTTAPAQASQNPVPSASGNSVHASSNDKERGAVDVARAQVLADTSSLDSKAAQTIHPVGSVQAARLVQSLRESQLQVGLHAGEFGKVNIHTSIDQNHIAARIYVEHEELGKALAGALPELHEKLELHHRLDAQVELYNTGSDQSDRQQHEQYQRTTQNFQVDRESSDPEPQVDTPPQVQSVATTVGLDMHA